MNILSIDIGSYSVKFLETRLERKQIYLLGHHEVVVAEAAAQLSTTMSLYEVQMEIIKSFLHDNYEGKIIFQVPNALTTSRFLTIPITNRKKVNMMIPFQLDENLPFSIANAHYSSILEKEGDKTKAVISITKRRDFEEYYGLLESKDLLPSLLTSELSVYHSYIRQKQIKGSVAIIDIGHLTSKAYFIYNGELISNHISFSAGKIIDDIISKTYDITPEEGSVYKHQNCFFLTENQYASVTKEQQEFAELMKETIWPLILELRRWELGHRVRCGNPVETYFLTGGTSKINNLANFMAQALSAKVEYLKYPESIIQSSDEIDGDEASFSLATLMAFTQKGKIQPANFLHGAYSGRAVQTLPLHSASFILSRSMIICLVILFFLLIERFAFLGPELREVDKTVKNMMKSTELNLTSRERREYAKRPDRVLKAIKKKSSMIKQEVKTIMAATQINAVTPLAKISSFLNSNPKIDLISFQSDGSDVRAEFKSSLENEVKILNDKLKDLELPEKRVEYTPGSSNLVLTFKGETP